MHRIAIARHSCAGRLALDWLNRGNIPIRSSSKQCRPCNIRHAKAHLHLIDFKLLEKMPNGNVSNVKCENGEARSQAQQVLPAHSRWFRDSCSQ